MDSPRFLSFAEVNYLHRESLARFGGLEGVREPGLVESALASAENTFYYANGTLFDVAASYAFHLAESQAFFDGNKRTAAAAALAFLRRNGKAMIVDDGTLYDAMIAIAKKTMDKRGLAAVLSRLCHQGANERQ